MPWLPGLAKPRFLRLVECVVPRSVALAFALRRHVSRCLVPKGSLKEVRNSTTCETGVHHFRLARNPRNHCVSSRCTRSSAG